MPKLSYLIFPLIVGSWFYGTRLYFASLEEFMHREQPKYGEGYLKGRETDYRDDELRIDDQLDNIFYFAQISDLHVSKYRRKYFHHLKIFLNTTLNIISPKFVVVTGDLTDAKDELKITSSQIYSEWFDYKTALAESGVLKKPGFWWDQRGNHDCFNVPSWNSDFNYFKELSVVKEEHYSFQIYESFGNYSFIALDACPIHGPSRPFNFFGYFDRSDMDFLERRLLKYHNKMLISSPFSMTLTATTSKGASFDELSNYISVFLCGHLHKLVGGLELELADMKSHGYYRIVAVDHDLISFIDTSILQHDTKSGRDDEVIVNISPLVLITNPKDSRYIIESKEPVHRIRRSTHIRLLAFSTNNIIEVRILVDGTEHRNPIKFSGNSSIPLWTSPWDPLMYDDSRTHNMTATVCDSSGLLGSQTVLFRVDSIREELNMGFSTMILYPRYDSIFKSIFLIIYLTIFVVLLLLPKFYSVYLHKTRNYHRWRIRFSAYLINLDKSERIYLPSMNSPYQVLKRFLLVNYLRLRHIYRDFLYFINATIFRLVTLASLASTFYPLFFYFVYIPIGPFFVGELIPSSRVLSGKFSDGLGWFYLYGVFIEGHWVPISDTWLYGIFELVYLAGPLIIYLSFCITPPEQLYSPRIDDSTDKNRRDIYYFPSRHNRRKYPLHRRIFVRMCVSFVVMYQMINVFFVGIYYGKWAMILSPGKTWFVIWGCTALYNHRWSSHGREIDLLEDDPEEEKWNIFAMWSKEKRQ